MMLSFFTENWGLKLFSLGMALALYTFVNFDSSTPVNVDFRIEYHTPDDILITNAPTTTVHTTLKGPGARWRSFQPGDLQPIVLDFSRAEPGTMRRSLSLTNVVAPTGLKVIDLNPSEVEVQFDRRVEGKVDVTLDVSDLPAFGYAVLAKRAFPAQVRVVGPAAKMQSLASISTRKIDISGREQDLNVEVDLQPPPLPLLLLDKRVSAFVEIGEEFVQRTFQNIAVRLEGGPKNARLSPASVSFTIKGPRRTVEGMERSSLEGVVRFAETTAGSSEGAERTVELRSELPERTQTIAPIPKVSIEVPQTHRARRHKR